MIVAAEVNYLKTEEMSRFYNKNFELLEPYEGKLSRIGNAVPPLLAEAIADRIWEMYRNE